MEDPVVEIAELRRTLSKRIEAAHFNKEPTMIKHGKHGEFRAAIVPAEWVAEIRELRAKVAELTAVEE